MSAAGFGQGLLTGFVVAAIDAGAGLEVAYFDGVFHYTAIVSAALLGFATLGLFSAAFRGRP